MMNLNNEIFYLINTKMSNSVFDIIMPNVTELGSLEVIAAVCIIFLILTRKNIFNLGKYYGLAKTIVLSVLLMFIVTSFIKLTFSMPRPYMILNGVNVLTDSIDPNSFPSGHTATAASFLTVIVINAKEYFKRYKLVICLAVLYVVLVGFSRIYIGMHFPTDVVTGAIIGIVCGIVATRILKV